MDSQKLGKARMRQTYHIKAQPTQRQAAPHDTAKKTIKAANRRLHQPQTTESVNELSSAHREQTMEHHTQPE